MREFATSRKLRLPVFSNVEMGKDSVSIFFVRQALQGLHRRGIAADGVLRAAGIPHGLLLSDRSRVSAASYSALWLAVAAALDDELFGLDSRRMKVGSFAILCRLALRSKNLREALLRITGLFNVLLDDTLLSSTVKGGQARLVLGAGPQPAISSLGNSIFVHETLLIMVHGLSCWLIGRRIPIQHAAFAYPQPPWSREYADMYSPDISFDRPETSIAFAAAYLDAAVVQTDRSLKEFLRSAPYNIVLKYKNAKGWSARIRRRLRATPPAAWPTFESLCAELQIPASTMHRKLEQEGLTFRDIKNSLRRDKAIDQLTHSDASLSDIAHALGFAEPSAFHRAFRQWTGVRPGEYRRKLAVAATN